MRFATEIPTLNDVHWERGQRVLLRADLNVPLKDGGVSDDTRLRAVLPTIEALREAGQRVILLSHLGRPGGQPCARWSLRTLLHPLQELLGAPVGFCATLSGIEVREASQRMAAGSVLLLENLRFEGGETTNDPHFARQVLAPLGKAYVNDAFGTAHRAHASTVALAHCFPGKAAIGRLFERELSVLNELLTEPKRPFVALLGGAKIDDKLAVVETLLQKADHVLLGGGMAYTFLAAAGQAIGTSLYQADQRAHAQALLENPAYRGRLHLPEDHYCEEEGKTTPLACRRIPARARALDIGLATQRAYAAQIERAGSVFWNGPMGLFERPAFAAGTMAMARTLAKSAAISVVGGGDSIAALRQAGCEADITHVSTGGGATLAYLEGRRLPALEALRRDAHADSH